MVVVNVGRDVSVCGGGVGVSVAVWVGFSQGRGAEVSWIRNKPNAASRKRPAMIPISRIRGLSVDEYLDIIYLFLNDQDYTPLPRSIRGRGGKRSYFKIATTPSEWELSHTSGYCMTTSSRNMLLLFASFNWT